MFTTTLTAAFLLSLLGSDTAPQAPRTDQSMATTRSLGEDVEQLKQQIVEAESKLRTAEADRGQKKVARDEAHDKVNAANKQLLAAKRAKDEAGAAAALAALREAQRELESAKNTLKIADDEVRRAKAEVTDLRKRLIKAQREAKKG